MLLTITNHDRASAQMRYVYPVLSRRSAGVSVGINLNTNRACNWACVYCQVEGLTRGAPEPVDLKLLESELCRFLQNAPDFLQKHAPNQAIKDIAFSGDGEPTAAPEFSDAVVIAKKAICDFQLKVPLRLITNGSLMNQKRVLKAIQKVDEVWFKIDRADESMTEINGVPFDSAKLRERLLNCTQNAPTFIQTCWFASSFANADSETLRHYIDFLKPFANRLKGVHLYGLARPSAQAQAESLCALDLQSLNAIGATIQAQTGLAVFVKA